MVNKSGEFKHYFQFLKLYSIIPMNEKIKLYSLRLILRSRVVEVHFVALFLCFVELFNIRESEKP